jgi:hypothetical protein
MEMGKYFGSELTSSKADNYSVNGLKQTRASNRHMLAFTAA